MKNSMNNIKRKYYEAYNERYQQIHSEGLQWFYDASSPIVMETIQEFHISHDSSILELGCGEGRDAYPLLENGYKVLATDISPAVIQYNQKKWPQLQNHFAVLDCVTGKLPQKYAFIYAIAVVHMLVEDTDRDGFYGFVRDHLPENGIALICSMGDGETERKTDIKTAFDLQNRIHEQSGKEVQIASTSCRMVNFSTFRQEISRNNLTILKEGITKAPPDFPIMMYAVVKNT